MLDFLSKLIIVTGHYGCGKTNLSVNLALDLRAQGREVILVDLDIVNPYFRTADFKGLAQSRGIKLLASPYANSNVELPVLTTGVEGHFRGPATVILDVGGDDSGAIALGRYAADIQQQPYTMLCVLNRFRNLTSTPKDAADMVEDIETASRLEVTYLVNNSNMGPVTTPQDITDSVPWAAQVAELSEKPLAFTSVRRDLAGVLPPSIPVYPVDIHVKTIWQ